jgi:hypothetical protein
MALINGLNSVAKGQTTALTLDKTALFALTPVAADDWFSIQSNVRFAKIIYRSSVGSQIKTVIFDLTLANPAANISFSARARDNFDLLKVILIDYEDDQLSVGRADLPAGLDIDFTP